MGHPRFCFTVLVLVAACTNHRETQIEVDWAAYGADVHGTRYSPAAAITRANVGRLEPAWTYRTREADQEFETTEPASFQTTPIVVDGLMYVSTPLGRVIALDPATGGHVWEFDPEIRRDVPYGDFASRGLSTWLDGTAPEGTPCRRSIYVANAQSQLVALDAADGRPCPAFGQHGRVDLRDGLRVAPFEDQAYSMTSPPVVANGVIAVGSSIADNTVPRPASGEIRGFDARSGELLWSWDPIPQDPSDPAYPEWRGEVAHSGGGGNAWSALSADPERDLVFIPTSSPAPDYYGGLRLGDNRYANSIVALRLSTGEYVWSYQTVHHDLWDYDNASPPALATVYKDGRDVPAVVQATKTGMLFVLHRETGDPLFPVEERSVPSSDLIGEEASPTQPFTTVTPPLSPHRMTIDEVWGLNAADREACREVVSGLRNEGIFTPPSTQGTLMLPSNIGGAHWGGLAIDQERRIAVVPVNRLASMVQLIPRASFDREAYQAEDSRHGHDYEYNPMRGTPYVMRRRILLGPSGLPCSPPPWGSLVAVDLGSGAILWQVPHGSFTRPFGEEGAGIIREEWGSPNLGGPIVTAGGLVFVAGSLDRWIRAYDIESGEELWRGALPESGRATPMTYQLESGEQFVVVTVGGGDVFGVGDYVVAFRLGAD